MRVLRGLAILALLAAVAFVAAWYFGNRSSTTPASEITAYYCKIDGTTLEPYTVTLGSARDRRSVAFYAATQAVAGPSADVEAVRFPPGTFVQSLDVVNSTAVVSLSKNVENTGGGSFTESGMFKALVWTLTAIPGISDVQVKVDNVRIASLPGGHLELDQPLTRSMF